MSVSHLGPSTITVTSRTGADFYHSARRIKCDEARPACQRCINAVRHCEGYCLPPAPAPAPDYRLLQPAAVVPSQAELALSRYFLAEIGAVAADEFNTTFWCREVPQVGRDVSAVWHASNALAGATWARSPRAGLTPSAAALIDQESTRQYSASVRHIIQMTTRAEERRRPSPHDQTIVLLASILLASYAIGIGEHAVSASIFTTSRRLIRQWAFWDCLDVPAVSALAAQILYVYVKTERVAQEFHLEAVVVDKEAAVKRRALPVELSPMRWCEALVALQRRPLTSAIRACLELDMMWNSVHDILDALPFQPTLSDVAAAHAQRHAFTQLFPLWEARYTAFAASSRTRSMPADIALAALDLRRALVRVLLRVPIGRCRPVWSETCWDPFARDFAAALSRLEAALRPVADVVTDTMLSTPSIYTSCNFIVQKCRAPALRRRAAAVLHSALVATLGKAPDETCKRQHLPLVVERLMRVEESAWEADSGDCGQDDECVPGRYICNMHRVARVHIDRTVAGPPEIAFLTVGDILHGRPGHHEAMDISLSSCAMGG